MRIDWINDVRIDWINDVRFFWINVYNVRIDWINDVRIDWINVYNVRIDCRDCRDVVGVRISRIYRNDIIYHITLHKPNNI